MNIIDFVIVAGGALATAVLTYVAYLSGRGYSVEDTESHASDYANVIKEGHGGLTAFLWVCFAAIVAWTIFYLVQHADEFSVIGGG